MGEYFERNRTRQFIELADLSYNAVLASQRLELQRLNAYQVSYRCEPAPQGAGMVRQLPAGTVVAVVESDGTWLVLYQNLTLGTLAPEAVGDLREKLGDSAEVPCLTAEIESVSPFGGLFKVRLLDEIPTQPAKRKPSKSTGKKQ